jgi:hypothetical protein
MGRWRVLESEPMNYIDLYPGPKPELQPEMEGLLETYERVILHLCEAEEVASCDVAFTIHPNPYVGHLGYMSKSCNMIAFPNGGWADVEAEHVLEITLGMLKILVEWEGEELGFEYPHLEYLIPTMDSVEQFMVYLSIHEFSHLMQREYFGPIGEAYGHDEDFETLFSQHLDKYWHILGE